MKTKPNRQKALPGRGGKKGCFLHGADKPEIDAEQVFDRANRLSGVLNKILTRPDAPEHYEFTSEPAKPPPVRATK